MEKEKLFYDLHQTIKEVSSKGDGIYLSSDSKLDWINKLTGELTNMDDETLNLVLDIYTRLTSYTFDNIEYIIKHPDEVKSIFYEDGEFIEKYSKLLYPPYIKSLMESPVITMHCFDNNIPSRDIWNCVLTCMCFGKTPIEDLILGKELSNREIINALPLLFKLNNECIAFAKTLNNQAGPLHKMQMDIYVNSKDSSYEKARNRYIEFLVKNMRDDETINRVIEYINIHEFDENTTLEEICNLDVNYSDLLKSSNKSNILVFPAFKELYKYSPKIAERLFELYSADEININEFEKLVHSFLDFDESQFEIIEKLL